MALVAGFFDTFNTILAKNEESLVKFSIFSAAQILGFVAQNFGPSRPRNITCPKFGLQWRKFHIFNLYVTYIQPTVHQNEIKKENNYLWPALRLNDKYKRR